MKIHEALKNINQPKNRPVIIASLFSVIGVFFLISSSAATPTVSIEPEANQSNQTCPSIQDNTSASGGKTIKFGCSPNTTGAWRGSALTGGGFVNMVSYSPTDDATKPDTLHVVSVTDVSGIFYSHLIRAN